MFLEETLQSRAPLAYEFLRFLKFPFFVAVQIRRPVNHFIYTIEQTQNAVLLNSDAHFNPRERYSRMKGTLDCHDDSIRVFTLEYCQTDQPREASIFQKWRLVPYIWSLEGSMTRSCGEMSGFKPTIGSLHPFSTDLKQISVNCRLAAESSTIESDTVKEIFVL